MRNILLLVVGVCAATTASGQCDRWLPGLGDPTLPGEGYSVCEWDPDGAGPLAPRMTVAAQSTDGLVVAWNGEIWERIGPSFQSSVTSVAVVNGELIALGLFTRVGTQTLRYAARWDGEAWRQLGDNPPQSCSSPLMFDGALHVRNAAGVWRLDGTVWSAVGPALSNVFVLCELDGKLVAGGSFAVPGSPMSRNIAVLEGGAWQPLGLGVNRDVYALAEWNGSLVAGGIFDGAGGQTAYGVAKWDGAAWSAMDAGLGIEGVRSLLVRDGQLMAGGLFDPHGARAARGRAVGWLGLAGDGERPRGRGRGPRGE